MHSSSSFPHGSILHTIDNIKARKLMLVQTKEFIQVSLVLQILSCVYIKFHVLLAHVWISVATTTRLRTVPLSGRFLYLFVETSTLLVPVPKPLAIHFWECAGSISCHLELTSFVYQLR